MNYLKTYCKLIRKAENRTLPEGYTENHHVFPKSIFGNNDRVVALTAREHYVAHALLEKICIQRYGVHHYKTHKMTHAFVLMCVTRKCENSYLYESAKLRKSEIGHSAETKAKISAVHKGREISQETRLKISASNKGRKKPPGHGEKISKANLGRKLSQEHKEKLSISKKGKKLSQNHKEKLSALHKGKVFSQETKEKLSIANSGENNSHSKWWRISFNDGRVLERCGLKNWARQNGYDCNNIYSVAAGRKNKYKDIIKVEKIIKE